MNMFADVMGEAFGRLHPMLQDVHSSNGRIEGRVNVQRGRFLAWLVCWILRFPVTKADTHLRVDFTHNESEMYWNRYFDGHPMPSCFRRQGQYLFERLGPVTMRLIPQEDAGRLLYTFDRAFFWGIPFPSFFSPTIEACEFEKDGQYHFFVCVSLPIIGRLIAYDGCMQRVETVA